MKIIWAIVVITALAGVGGTGMGAVVSTLFRRDSSKIVSLLLGFAAGVMISVICFDLLVSAISPEGATEQTNILLVILGILLGYGIVWLLNVWIDKSSNKELPHIDNTHPQTADSLDELIHADHLQHHLSAADRQKRQLFSAGLVMAAAIALHNMPEGMVIGASFADADATTLLSQSGIVMAVIIGLHNIPEGMSIAVPLLSGGMKPAKAVGLTALTGVPTILGALLGFFLGKISDLALALSLSFASGAMLYVVFGELLPESILMLRSKGPALAVLTGMLVGLCIIYI